MKDKPNANKSRQARYKDRMAEKAKLLNVWVDRDYLARLEAVALAKGWISESGRKCGGPDMQRAIMEAIRAGVERLEGE